MQAIGFQRAIIDRLVLANSARDEALREVAVLRSRVEEIGVSARVHSQTLAEVEELRSELAEAHRTAEEAQSAFSEYQARAKSEAESLSARLAEQDRMLRESRDQYEDARRRARNERKEVARLEQEVELFRSRADKLREEAIRRNGDIDRLRGEAACRDNELNTLREEAARRGGELNSVRNQLFSSSCKASASLDNEFSFVMHQMQGEVTKLQGIVLGTQKKVENARLRNLDLKARLAEAQESELVAVELYKGSAECLHSKMLFAKNAYSTASLDARRRIQAEYPGLDLSFLEREGYHFPERRTDVPEGAEVGTAEPEVPCVEAPGTEIISAEAPMAEAMSTEAPAAETLLAEVPAIGASSAEVPAAEVLSAEVPVVEASSTEVPMVETLEVEDSPAEASEVEVQPTERDHDVDSFVAELEATLGAPVSPSDRSIFQASVAPSSANLPSPTLSPTAHPPGLLPDEAPTP